MASQCSFRCPGNGSTVLPSLPGLPWLACTPRNAGLQFSRSQTSSFHCSVAGLSTLRFAPSDSLPPSKAVGAAPLLSSGKARRYWLFCRLSVLELRRVLLAPFLPCRGPFRPSLLAPLLRPLLTPATCSETISRSSVLHPEPVAGLPRYVRPPSTRNRWFYLQCPGWLWASLPLASSPEHCLPPIQFLFIGSRPCSTLLSDLTSRLGPCASLSLHLPLVGKRTCTSKLSNMLGTPKKRGAAKHRSAPLPG